MLGVLTNKLYLLSKPVTPIVVTGAVAGRLLLNCVAKIVQRIEKRELEVNFFA